MKECECKKIKEEIKEIFSEMGEHVKKCKNVNDPINESAKKFHKYFKVE